jgi:filamentous hemagglutinin family protein
MTINQSTQNAIINWKTFNIGASESVRFNQPNSGSVALNRVIGGLGPSQILGSLTANGRIFLINRDGILFGPGAVVNTAGFLASTNDIRNSDFMAGRYNFNIPGRPDASIVNQGRITATSGGFAALVAPGVRNSGTITATLGTVALAAGNSFTLDMYGDKLITLAVNDEIAANVIDVATGKPLKSLVTNDGKIRANGGRVELTAAAARRVVDSVINTSGVITANSIGHRNGKIVLAAATGASKPAGAPAQTIKISGRLSAAGKRPGTKGGSILVSGEHIKLAAARVDASGRAGGGKVLIGGDWAGGHPTMFFPGNPSARPEAYAIPTASTVSVDAASRIDASAKSRGDGGKVILWADNHLTFTGTILALGGREFGNGGFVETSGHSVNITGTVNAGNGRDPDAQRLSQYPDQRHRRERNHQEYRRRQSDPARRQHRPRHRHDRHAGEHFQQSRRLERQHRQDFRVLQPEQLHVADELYGRQWQHGPRERLAAHRLHAGEHQG